MKYLRVVASLAILINTVCGLEVGLDGKQRDATWPSKFLVNGKIPSNVAKAEIDASLSDVLGANKGKNADALLKGLNTLRELHLRMVTAKADETYLMKLTYFLVRQSILVKESGLESDGNELVDHFVTLEAWFFRNQSLAKKTVSGFDKGLAYMRKQVSKYALSIYRAKKMKISIEQLHEGYSNLLSSSTSQVRGQAGQCANQNFARSDCYECASWAMEKALRNGFGQSDPWHDADINKRLNSPQYANQFHRGWIEEKDRNVFRLTRVFSSIDNSANEKENGIKAALEAPKGSVLIWNICGSHPAGHIAIKTSTDVAASSFKAPIQRTCGNPNAQIVGVYAPVDNSIEFDLFHKDQTDALTASDEKSNLEVEQNQSGNQPEFNDSSDFYSDLSF